MTFRNGVYSLPRSFNEAYGGPSVGGFRNISAAPASPPWAAEAFDISKQLVARCSEVRYVKLVILEEYLGLDGIRGSLRMFVVASGLLFHNREERKTQHGFTTVSSLVEEGEIRPLTLTSVGMLMSYAHGLRRHCLTCTERKCLFTES